MERILVLDNYDSFTYNLVHYLESAGVQVDVFRNDQVSLSDAAAYPNILFSPGPGLPSAAGIMCDLIRKVAPTHHLLGVCLGHQAIGEVFGAELYNLETVYHGIATPCRLTDRTSLFKGLPEEIMTGRYHSWSVREPLPEALLPMAVDEQNRIMAIRHKQYSVYGVQFHPESILTEHGMQMIRNWLELSKNR